MSKIDETGINEKYPIQGQNNPSQGFRDNFATIKTALNVAKNELAWLQTNSLTRIKYDETGGTAVVADNDLNGSKITNGTYSNFYGIVKNHGAIPTTNTLAIDVTSGVMHATTISTDSDITFKWPAATSKTDGKAISIRLHVGNTDTASDYKITFTDPAVKLETKISDPTSTILTLAKKATTTIYKVFDVWSMDAGNTVYVSYVGEF